MRQELHLGRRYLFPRIGERFCSRLPRGSAAFPIGLEDGLEDWTVLAVALLASAPGKILVAGEYAILVPGASCLVMAVASPPAPAGRGGLPGTGAVAPTRAVLEPGRGQGVVVRAPSVGVEEMTGTIRAGRLRWDPSAGTAAEGESPLERLRFVTSALEVCLRTLSETGVAPRPFELTVESDSRKLGLGGSSSVSVAVAGAILTSHGWDLDDPLVRRRLFALSVLAHHEAQGRLGSGFDVAAAVFGGAGVFVSGDPKVLHHEWREGRDETLSALDRSSALPRWLRLADWPGRLHWAVGWTGDVADTRRMLELIARQDSTARARYEDALSEIGDGARKLIHTIRAGDLEAFLITIQLLDLSLVRLADETGLPIQTPGLRRLVRIAEEHGCAAKSLGAGGGDCGVCFSTDAGKLEETRSAWKANGILPLDLECAVEGVKIDITERTQFS